MPTDGGSRTNPTRSRTRKHLRRCAMSFDNDDAGRSDGRGDRQASPRDSRPTRRPDRTPRPTVDALVSSDPASPARYPTSSSSTCSSSTTSARRRAFSSSPRPATWSYARQRSLPTENRSRCWSGFRCSGCSGGPFSCSPSRRPPFDGSADGPTIGAK